MSYPPQPPQNEFSQPSAGGDSFEPREFNGALLLIYPKSFQAEVQTKNGLSAAADVDVVVVDRAGPDGRPLFFKDARLFGNLARSVRNDIGRQVLGRLGQGPNTRGTPPWILQNYTDQDAAAAGPVHAQYQQGLFQGGSNPMAGGTPAGYAQTPPTPAPQAAPPQQAYAPQAPGTPPYGQQQYAPAPAGQPAAPAPAQAPAGAANPADLAKLAQHGITLQPGASPEQIAAIAATLP